MTTVWPIAMISILEIFRVPQGWMKVRKRGKAMQQEPKQHLSKIPLILRWRSFYKKAIKRRIPHLSYHLLLIIINAKAMQNLCLSNRKMLSYQSKWTSYILVIVIKMLQTIFFWEKALNFRNVEPRFYAKVMLMTPIQGTDLIPLIRNIVARTEIIALLKSKTQ